jgi:AbiV family abortive infection protein
MSPLETIAANSTRIYSEALHCSLRKEFATATALAIFSFEEAAKFAIYKREAWRPSLPKKRVYKHEVKHEEMGELFWYWAIFSVLSKTFDEFKSFATTLPEADQDTMDFIAGLSGGSAVDFIRQGMFQTEDEMRTYVKERFPHPELLDVAAAGSSGAIEALRRRALYVDLSRDKNQVTTSPESLSEADATEWLKVAWFGQEYIKLARAVWA